VQLAPDAFVEGPETETKEFVPGTTLGYCGDYELLQEIARGGMGVVYKARQSTLKRIVAVKMIRAGELAGEAEVQRFRTEAQAAAQLQHPNIVAIHEIGEDRGRHYFSMDFVEGKNLAQIADGRPVAAQKAAQWLKTIAEAVQYAHQRGVLHRDLKPQNIMLDAAGRPRVTDFGLAKMAGDSTITRTGAVMGSPSYMSPEQARGRNDLVGPASDVYSLGAILYELLTGQPPFRGKTPLETLSEVVNDEPRPPHALNPGTPTDLETICLKCLEKEPVRRYPTARELELDLGRFLAGEPVQARPADTLRKTTRWARRHRSLFAMAASFLILALMGLAYGLWEETQRLAWLNAHPGASEQLLRSLPVTDDKKFGRLVIRGWVLSFWLFPVLRLGYRILARGAAWRRIFEPMRHAPAPGVALAFGAIAAAGVAGALFIGARWIALTVWYGSRMFIYWIVVALIFIYPLFALWFAFLMAIVRDQRRIYIGPSQADVEAALSPEQFDSIREPLSEGNFRKAVKKYRAATRTPSAEAKRRVQEMAESRVSDEQLAAIHRALFAGRTAEAAGLFQAATWLPEHVVRGSIARMYLELYRLHPDKFTAGRFEKTAMANAQRRVRQGLGMILTLCLGIWLFPQFRQDLINLALGIASGALLRAVNWKRWLRTTGTNLRTPLSDLIQLPMVHRTQSEQSSEYRRTRFILWLGRWCLFILLISWIVIGIGYLLNPFKPPQYSLHPIRPMLLPGILAGWLWIHLSLKYPVKFSGKVAAKVKRFSQRLQGWTDASYTQEVRNWGLAKARRLSEAWSCITGLFFLWTLFFPKVPPGPQLFWLAVGVWIGASTRARSWKEVYRRMGFTMRLVAWVVVVTLGFCATAAYFELFVRLTHAHDWQAWIDPGVLLLLGSVAAWFWVHVLLRKHKAP
jgi:tRNA A-37 threonylcarbamoyl transferase component Bud32